MAENIVIRDIIANDGWVEKSDYCHLGDNFMLIVEKQVMVCSQHDFNVQLR